MKFHKLYWLIWFFVQRIRRQLGGITRWERKDLQAISKYDWEWCMFKNSLRELQRKIGAWFAMTTKEAANALGKTMKMELYRKREYTIEEYGAGAKVFVQSYGKKFLIADFECHLDAEKYVEFREKTDNA